MNKAEKKRSDWGVALGPMPMGPRARASLDPPLITVLFFILLESFVMSKHCLAL